MDTSITSESNKKINLEELSKDDLIKKCKSLLLIAQKAKQAKDVLQEENNKLRQELANSNEASQEIIEKITQQKLSLVTHIEDLKAKNCSLDSQLQIFETELRMCQEKYNTADNESQSYERQVIRLTDENEQLISHLDSLEKQIDKLNKIGFQQQQQLLEVEKNKSIQNKTLTDDNKITELQSMLKVSLGEVKELKSANTYLNKTVDDLRLNLSEKDQHLLSISEELQFKQDAVDTISQELTDLRTVKIKNKELMISYEKLKLELNELTNTNRFLNDKNAHHIKQDTLKELQELNEKLKEKLKLYHSKIIKLAGNAKALKEEKNQVLQLFKLYTDQVKIWKNQLDIVGQKLVAYVNIEAENLKLKENIRKIKCKVESDNIEKEKLFKTISEYKNHIEVLKNEKDCVSTELEDLKIISIEVKDVMQENNKLHKNISECKDECLKLAEDIEDLSKSSEEYENKVEHAKLLQLEQVTTDLKAQLKSYEDDKQHTKATEKQLAEKSSEEIQKLVQENKELFYRNNDLKELLDKTEQVILNRTHSECQTDGGIASNDLEEQLINLKQENAELLSEMNEMNQAIKERGENISKLEAHCEEIMKKLQHYETQANKNVESITLKDTIIKKLREELESLRVNKQSDVNLIGNEVSSKDVEIENLKNETETLQDKPTANFETSYAESETMSTSTLSRTEENNRLKDLEGSWEERYGKLRNLAIKLKAKIRELTATIIKEQNEKEEFQKKVSLNLKTIQTLQSQSDKLEDELEDARQQCKQYLNRLNSVAEDISKDKQLLFTKEDIIDGLKKTIELLKNEKQTTENWKKQVSAKVQTLRKELEANNVLKKEFEIRISKLVTDLESKDQTLKTEIESHNQTKNLLDQSTSECKKNSVLSLEMQDYERSIKETAKKLEKYQEEISKLKGQVDSQKSTINALREQNKLLEDRIQTAESSLNAGTSEISGFKKKINGLDEEIQQKEDKVQSLTLLLESSRSENEDLSTELSKVIAEHQKTNNILKNERDHLRSRTLGLQQSLRDIQDNLKLKEDELKVIKDEYEGYKVRAQSVLRQNQNRDVGLEEKLSEELSTLKSQNISLLGDLKENREKTKMLENVHEILLSEKEQCKKKIQDLEIEIEEIKNQHTQLIAKHQKTLNEHAETIRSLKVHADTLSQCYRQQLSEQEVRHNREIIELQSRIDKAPSPTEPFSILPTMTREEGEGSESIESNNATNPVYPVPLERLLGSDSDQEITYMKKQLNELESKSAHLTALLSDTEQDLAKHVQMNKLLKEEIRRQQRSVEREKHAENLEYLKNVIFKFVTLNSGDEKTRLVPVLNTILKLSPEETSKLSIVAKGDLGIKGWSNYLPTWSSPNKPQ